MDYGKVDAALAAVLATDEERAGESDSPSVASPPMLSVFLHVDPVAAKRKKAALAKLGLTPASLQGGIGTATLSPDQVRELSEQPWVRQIRLSQRLRLLDE